MGRHVRGRLARPLRGGRLSDTGPSLRPPARPVPEAGPRERERRHAQPGGGAARPARRLTLPRHASVRTRPGQVVDMSRQLRADARHPVPRLVARRRAAAVRLSVGQGRADRVADLPAERRAAAAQRVWRDVVTVVPAKGECVCDTAIAGNMHIDSFAADALAPLHSPPCRRDECTSGLLPLAQAQSADRIRRQRGRRRRPQRPKLFTQPVRE